MTQMGPNIFTHYEFGLKIVTFTAIRQQTCESEFPNGKHQHIPLAPHPTFELLFYVILEIK